MVRPKMRDLNDSETWDMEVTFTGKGHVDGSPWIALECLKAPGTAEPL